MKHLGDITKISGYEVPMVDIVCGGSPCQDLSLAGKRAGLAGARSGLFMEQIRIIREMRERSRQSGVPTNDIRPRYMVWENVPGAFSSNQGEDFRAVLEETSRIADESAVIPKLEKGQKWSPSGAIMGDGWSVAWRVHDAQFWGVPQRRKRISLVADFSGQSATKILFESESLSRDYQTSRREGNEVAGSTSESLGKTIADGMITKCYDMDNERRGSMKETEEYSPTLTARAGSGGNNVPCVVKERQESVIYGQGSFGNYKEAVSTLRAKGGDMGGGSENLCIDTYQKVVGAVDCGIAKGTSNQLASQDMFIVRPLVRKLTPLECERLQGFPDNWTDIGDWRDSKGKLHKGDSDRPRYIALGNSIALPFWQYMAEKMVAQYDRPTTMASLFDGIGGFPLVYSRCGCKPVWASEIEEFPIAVTKYHFPEGEENDTV